MARKKAFDPQDALEAAQHCFEVRGFEATSIEDLLQCTGLSRASLYNAFGDKQQLFDAVLDRYEAAQLQEFRAKAAKAASPRDALRMILTSTAGAGAKHGCLVMNTGMELGPSDPVLQARVLQSLNAVHVLFRDLVRQVDPSADPEPTASMLQATFLGLRVLARTGASRTKILAIANQTIAKLLP